MDKFTKGFREGDEIKHTLLRYVVVTNNGKEYTIGDNGERRQRIIKNGSIKHGKPLNGNLSLNDIR